MTDSDIKTQVLPSWLIRRWGVLKIRKRSLSPVPLRMVFLSAHRRAFHLFIYFERRKGLISGILCLVAFTLSGIPRYTGTRGNIPLPEGDLEGHGEGGRHGYREC